MKCVVSTSTLPAFALFRMFHVLLLE